MTRPAVARSVVAVAPLERLRTHMRVPLYRNAYALSLSAMGSAALGAIFWAVAAHVYHRHVIGESSAAVAALMFVSGVAGLYLDGVLYRFLPRAGAASMRLVVETGVVTVVAGVVGTIVFLLGLPLWAPDLKFLGSSFAVVAACAAATVTTRVLTLQDATLTGLRRTGWVPVKNLAYNALKIPVLVALAASAPKYGILLAWIVPGGVIAAIAAYGVYGRVVPDRMHARIATARGAAPVPDEILDRMHILRYATGNYVGFLCTLAYRTLPPIIVLREAGANAAGSFYPPWLIATSLSLIVTNLSVSLVVEGALERERLALHVRQALLQTARLVLPIVAVLVLLAPYVLQIFGGAYAKEGTNLLRLLAIGLIPGAVCILGFGIARVRDRVRSLIVTQVALGVIVLGLGTVLIGPFGLDGMGISFLIGQTAIAIVVVATELAPALRARPLPPPDRPEEEAPSHGPRGWVGSTAP